MHRSVNPARVTSLVRSEAWTLRRGDRTPFRLAAAPVIATAALAYDLGNLMQIEASAIGTVSRTPDMPAVNPSPILGRGRASLPQAAPPHATGARGSGKSLVADAYLFVMLRWAGAFNVPISRELSADFQRVCELPPVRQALAEERPGALPLAVDASSWEVLT